MAVNKWGVTPEGFKRPRLAEIKAELEADYAEALGCPINTRPDSVFGQIIGVNAAREARLWEMAEGVYYAMYPQTADGVSLANAVAFSGVRPIGAEKTTIIVTCCGKNNTVLPYGTRLQSAIDSQQSFSSTQVGTISSNAASYAEITVAAIVAGAQYSITVDGSTVMHQANTSSTAASILVALSSQLNSIAATVSVSNDKLTIDRVDHRAGFAIALSTNLLLTEVGSPVEFAADTAGAINPQLNTVTQIISQVAGWTRAFNRVPAAVGRNQESDSEIRLRYGRSVYRKGQSLIEAIAARLYEEVSGVTAAMVFENTSDTIDSDGRPPHSIEAVVQGGDDTEVAQKVWQTKPPGIATHGTTAIAITDSQGVRRTMRFNRPTVRKVWIKIIITKNPDESFPGDTPERVRNLVLADGQNHKIGQDVILQRFFGNIYKNTLGIGSLTITAAVKDTTPGAGDYTTSNIVIGVRELASFAAERIEVTVV